MAIVMLGGLILATAIFGVSVEGASRWIRVAGVSLQVSIIAVPVMLVAYARAAGPAATLGIMLSAVALALQPDRAMAGVLVAALSVLVLYRRERLVGLALSVAVAGFAITLLRADTLPAVAYVDQILFTAFEVHPLAGAAVLGGAILLVVPGVVNQKLDPTHRHVHAVFGTVWLSMVVAAALGNYPTPLVGYGGSAILGYALSLTPMPRFAWSPAGTTSEAGPAVDEDTGGHFKPAVASPHPDAPSPATRRSLQGLVLRHRDGGI